MKRAISRSNERETRSKERKKKKLNDDDEIETIEEYSKYTDYVSSKDYQGGLTSQEKADDDTESDDEDSDSDFCIDDIDDDDDDEGDLEDRDCEGSQEVCATASSCSITAVCPYPAPKGQKRQPKNPNVISLQGREMVQLLRNRTSLHPITSEVDEKSDKKDVQLLKSTLKWSKSCVEDQNWKNSVQDKIKEEPQELVVGNMECMMKVNLEKLAEKECLFWSLQPDAEKMKPSSRFPYWKTALVHWLIETNPKWMYYSQKTTDECLLYGEARALKILNDQCKADNDFINCSQRWINRLENGMQKTLLLMKKFRILEAEIESKPKHLDEFCHWGKKYLLFMLSPPYFKLTPSDVCYMADPQVFLQNRYDDALVDVSKQKWTTKDFKSLQKFIKDVIVEAIYAQYSDRDHYLTSRIVFERANRLEVEQERRRIEQEMALQSVSHSERVEAYNETAVSGSKKGNFRANRKKRVADCEYATTTLERKYKIEVGSRQSVVSARITITAQDLQKWFHDNEVRLSKLNYADLTPQHLELIDWNKVAAKLALESGKDRSANDCLLAWRHEADPHVNVKRWSAAELKQLLVAVALHKSSGQPTDWSAISRMGNNRTPYQCLYKYRNRVIQNDVMTWDEVKSQNVVNIIMNEGSKWRKSVDATDDIRATKQQVQERWKKTCNPVLRHGAFTRVEDALLLLQIEKLKDFMNKEHNFGILISYLPWRFETVWRDRANHLFSNWIVPWTKEEDETLLRLAEEQGEKKNWQIIADQFTSFKNRKGCLTRHKILRRRIGQGKKFATLDEYHEAYSMFRYNVFQYKHLRDVVALLKRVLEHEMPEEPFLGLRGDAPPEEKELQYMLLDYDRGVMMQTINNLENYIQSRDDYWKAWNEKNKIKRTFDRRTFRKTDPKSVASALHMRRLKIKSKTEIARPLTPFEEDIMMHFARFSRTKALKEKLDRPYIPSAKELKKMPEISEIVELPSDAELNESDSENYAESDAEIEEPPRKRARSSTNAKKVKGGGFKRGSKSKMNKKESTSKVTRKRSKIEVSKEESMSRVTRNRSNIEISKDESNCKASKKESTSKASKKESTSKASKKESTSKASKKEINGEVPKKLRKNEVSKDESTSKVPKKLRKNEVSKEESTSKVTRKRSNIEVSEEKSMSKVTRKRSNIEVSEEESMSRVTKKRSKIEVSKEESTSNGSKKEIKDKVPKRRSECEVSQKESKSKASEKENKSKDPKTGSNIEVSKEVGQSRRESKRLSLLNTPETEPARRSIRIRTLTQIFGSPMYVV